MKSVAQETSLTAMCVKTDNGLSSLNHNRLNLNPTVITGYHNLLNLNPTIITPCFLSTQ